MPNESYFEVSCQFDPVLDLNQEGGWELSSSNCYSKKRQRLESQAKCIPGQLEGAEIPQVSGDEKVSEKCLYLEIRTGRPLAHDSGLHTAIVKCEAPSSRQ